MDILKSASDWVKAELFSTPFFIVFGILFIAASIGFWQLGKTDMAKAYIIPTLIAGVMLMIIGFGLFFTNKARVSQFEKAYHADAQVFVQSELERADATIKEYKNIVFTAIPIIIAICAIVIIFINASGWRAGLITTIAMLVVILLIDGTASARIENYNKQLIEAEKQE